MTPFFPQYENKNLKEHLGVSREQLSITLDDERFHAIKNACKQNHLFVSPNLYVEEKGWYYDMSMMINQDGELIGRSKMVHIYQGEKFYEKDYYTPSEEGFLVYDLPFGKVGVVICFDRHLPESIRTCALKGAELIIIPTANTREEPMELFEWELRVQAFQNNVFIAMCNRVGLEDNMDFAGQSLLVDSDGNVIFKADEKEQLIVQEIDLSKAKESRKSRPYLSLRRLDMYQ